LYLIAPVDVKVTTTDDAYGKIMTNGGTYNMRFKSFKTLLHALIVLIMVGSSFSYLLTGNLTYKTPTALADPPKVRCADGTLNYIGTCSSHGGVANREELSESDSEKRRFLIYMSDCLKNEVDWDGKANDKNNDNIEFEGWGEFFKPKGQVIAVGADIDDKNGVLACGSIAERAVKAYDSSISNYQDWLMKKVWGKTIAENKGKRIPVGTGSGEVNPKDVKKNAESLAGDMTKKADQIKGSADDKKLTLIRLQPLLTQCFVSWSSKPTKSYTEEGDIRMEKRKVYAKRNAFDWKDVTVVSINGNDGVGPDLTGAELGDIYLGFDPGSGSNTQFDDRKSTWFPIGNDLGKNILGENYKNRENQSFLSCNWIRQHEDYLFAQTVENRYYFAVDGTNLKIKSKVYNEDGDEVETTVADVSTDPSGDGGGSGDACGGGSGGGALRWILCPVVSAINSGIAVITEDFLAPALATEGLQNNGTLYDAWWAIHNLANALLVVVFLVIIFMNFFAAENSAYTVKKALPRLVAAAILIQLSYLFCSILIDIGNVLGDGIGQLVTSAAGSAGGSGASAGASIASGLLVSAAGVGGGIVITVLGAWVLFLPLVIGLVISILTLLLSLGTRIIAINLLVMLAPVALMAWTLPNTEKYSKMWISNMLKLVMMYPLIILMMSAAQVVVKIGAGSDGNTFAGVLTLFAPMIAFFMIPATFKMSGTIISGINSAIASKGKSFSGATAGALSKSMRDTIGKKAALTFSDPNSGRIRKTASRFGMGLGTGFGIGDQSRMKRASVAGAAFKEKKDLLHHDFEEKGISGDNAKMMEEIFDKEKGEFRADADATKRAAVMQMIGENGGVEEMSSMYEALRAKNGGVSRSGDWENDADKELWNKGTATSRDKLAKALPYAVRPDADKSVGKLDAEAYAGLKGAAGKYGHISSGISGIRSDQAKAKVAMDAAQRAGNKAEYEKQKEIHDSKQTQLQKAFASMVGVGQSTDRRGRIDSDVVKDWAQAVKNGDFAGITLDVGGTSMTAEQFATTYIDPTNNQLKAVPTAGAPGVATDEDTE
jgi:hypothetical protein